MRSPHARSSEQFNCLTVTRGVKARVETRSGCSHVASLHVIIAQTCLDVMRKAQVMIVDDDDDDDEDDDDDDDYDGDEE